MSLYTSELHAKRVELLDEFVPAGAPVGMIVNPKMPDTDPQVQSARTIPIVFVNVADPVGSGLVASFAHPGGNITGFTNMEFVRATPE
jgi:ABC transporter substrate binding protein